MDFSLIILRQMVGMWQTSILLWGCIPIWYGLTVRPLSVIESMVVITVIIFSATMMGVVDMHHYKRMIET